MARSYSTKITVRLGRTDAAGIWYFVEALDLAHEVLEECLASLGMPLHSFLVPGSTRLPIVHAEADFMKAVRCGDKLDVRLMIARCSPRSFTVNCEFSGAEGAVARTSIVHAGASPNGQGPADLPETLVKLLNADS